MPKNILHKHQKFFLMPRARGECQCVRDIRTVVWEMNIILLATKIAPSFIYPNSPIILQSPHLTIPHSKGFLTEMKEMKPRTITQGVLET